jgi:hypothetical protein
MADKLPGVVKSPTSLLGSAVVEIVPSTRLTVRMRLDLPTVMRCLAWQRMILQPRMEVSLAFTDCVVPLLGSTMVPDAAQERSVFLTSSQSLHLSKLDILFVVEVQGE